jgi:hypothetical protein
MSTLETAISTKRWELAAHVLVLAALQTLDTQGGRPGDGKKARRRKSHNRRT